MRKPAQLISAVSDLLASRYFSDSQITKLLPKLHDQFYKQPEYLGEIIDAWNGAFGITTISKNSNHLPPTATPPKTSILFQQKIDMTVILADVEPDLLLLKPDSVIQRHDKIEDIAIARDLSQHWTLLFNAPRGFYLQDWMDLMKKVYYVEHNVLDLLYDKKEQKEMDFHPILKSAATMEADFDHIRTRYLFALRCGYKTLSHLYKVGTVFDRPTLKDLILTDNKSYLKRFAPYCSTEEYQAFAQLIKSHDLDQDDADIFESLAELNSLDQRAKD